MSTRGWNGLRRRRSVWLPSPPAAALVVSKASRWTPPPAPSLFAVTLLLDLRRPVVGAGAVFGLFAVRLLRPETRPRVAAADGAEEPVGAAPRDRRDADQERR